MTRPPYRTPLIVPLSSKMGTAYSLAITESTVALPVGRALGVDLTAIGALPGKSSIVASSAAGMIRVPPTGLPFSTADRAISLGSVPRSAPVTYRR